MPSTPTALSSASSTPTPEAGPRVETIAGFSDFAGFAAGATRFLFFTGKGGVGKTSLACATAVYLADQGRSVLLVSTDPASNLDEVLGCRLGSVPTPIPGAPGLAALNLDPAVAAREYREKLIGPLRGRLPESALRSMEEQLSGACTMEIAAFDEFSRLLGDESATAGHDHVIFDTAPTGHTLRLLTLPRAWTGFLEANTSGTSCLGPLAGLQRQRSLYEASVAALADGRRTTLVLVSRPQDAALREAERTAAELAELGVRRQCLLLNGRFHASVPDDPTAQALEARGTEALTARHDFLQRQPVLEIPLRPQQLLGLDGLRALVNAPATIPVPPASPAPQSPDPGASLPSLPGLEALVAQMAPAGRGLILTMGKGGVGKTTLAAALAFALARAGHAVHLSTTDPAAHVAAAAGGGIPGLSVSRIDPEAETAAYVRQVLETTGASLDPASRALLEEDLRSPCTAEIAVFRAFARTVGQAVHGFVVLDTAPTGHTLLLLDATEAYHREVAKRASDLPDEVRELLPRLRDPDFTRVLIVAIPEATPVHEAAALQADLRRAGIEPAAWILNQSLACSDTRDPLLRQRAAQERPFLNEVSHQLSRQTFLVPWVPREPAGPEGLAQLFNLTAPARPS